MKVLLMTLGSRGDAEPFLTLGSLLLQSGHDVALIAPEQFRAVGEQVGVRFHAFPAAFLELLDNQQGRDFMGGRGNRLAQVRNLVSLARQSMKLQREIIGIQQAVVLQEQPDRVVYHPKCLVGTVWGMAHRGRARLLCPLPLIQHPVSYATTVGPMGHADYGGFINRRSFTVVNTVKAYITLRAARRFRSHYSPTRYSLHSIYRFMLHEQRTLYTISPTLFERPIEWPETAYIVGYHERDKTTHWQPDSILLDFAARHSNILLITFGSMPNNDPEGKSRAIVEVLRRRGIPAIINCSWGGLQRVESAPDHILFVDSIPYDWAFERVYAVVHHGGSGTTHTAMRYGCATSIVPHIADQYYWSERIAELGVGPKGVPIKKFDEETFDKLINELLADPGYKRAAEDIAERTAQEGNVERYLRLVLEKG